MSRTIFATKKSSINIPTANLVGLYRFDAINYYSLNAGRVSTVFDQSGNNNHLSQSSANNRPLISTNGGPSAQDCGDFTLNAGLSRYVQIASMGLGSNISIYLISQAPAGVRYITDGAVTADSRLIYSSDSLNVKLFAGTAACSNPIAAGNWMVYAGIFNGLNSFSLLNSGAPVTGNPGTPSDVGFTLGGRQDGASAAGLNAKLLLCAVYSVSHTSATALSINNILRAWSGV